MNEELKALLAKLKELSDAELTELLDSLMSEYDDVKKAGVTPEVVGVLTEIADAKDSVDAEIQVRETAVAEAQAKVEELDKRIKGEDETKSEDEGESDDADKEDEKSDDDSKEGEGESTEGEEAKAEKDEEVKAEEPEVKAESETKPAEAEDKKLPIAASSSAPLASIKPSGRGTNKKPVEKRGHNRILNQRATGEFATLQDVAKAMIETRESFGTVTGGVSERVRVARIKGEYPKDRQLTQDGEMNTAIVAAAIKEEDAIVASGGICAPTAPYYGLANISDADRPVRAALQNFQANRGGINFVQPPSLPDFDDAITIWTAANDADESPSPSTKSCLTVDCGDPVEVQIDAIVRCLQFGNMGARAFPEQVENATALTLAAHARVAESKLLDGIKTNSTAVTGGTALGALRDLLYQVGVAAAGVRSRHRTLKNAVLDVLMPQWAIDMAREDLARSLPAYADQLGAADSVITDYFARRNVRLNTYIDSPTTGTSQIFSTQNVSALNDFPDVVQWAIYHNGAHLFLDDGVLDLGLVRDSTLNETNDYQTFAETFEQTAFIGVESIWVSSTVCPSGASSGTVDPDEFCSGAYVPV